MIPPSTIWPSTPATSPSESSVRSRRRGVRHSEPSTAAITATATTPVNSRLTCSMAAWFDDTSMSCSSLQLGQSTQPSPEPVRRTAAPVMTMAIKRDQGGERDRSVPRR